MFENENNSSELTNAQLVDLAFSDKELSKLPLGSDEFNAAAAKLMAAKTNERVNESADVTSEQDTEDEENVETDEGSEDSDDQSEDSAEQKPVKKSRGMLRRIEKLVEEKAELKRRLDQLQGSKQMEAQATAAVEDSGNFDKPKPKFADFDSLEDYTEALTEWKIDKREFEKEQAAEIREVKTKQQEVVQSWHQKEADVKKEFRDYADVVNIENLQSAQPTSEARVFLAESEVGPKVLYTLLSNDELAKKFSEASPVQQVKMLTKIEMQVDDSSSNKVSNSTVKISKAPNPPKNLPSGKVVRTAQDLLSNSEDMDWAEWSRKVDEVRRKK